jgi:ABC-type glutathione transport system ATPase component
MNTMNLLSASLNIGYPNKPLVMTGLNLDIRWGEILGLVGHSGCGKSSLAFALLGLLESKGGKVSGSIRWDEKELLDQKERDWLKIRGKDIAFVPQSAVSSLNPALRLDTQLNEAWKLHAHGNRHDRESAIAQALSDVSLPFDLEFRRRKPSQISVGQAQRVLIAMAILHRPRLLIADEPTSALDPITQSEILSLFAGLNRKLGMSILFISHDLLSVYALCHRVALMDGGSIVECNTPQEIFFNPVHPFTQKLVAAMPRVPTSAEVERALVF